MLINEVESILGLSKKSIRYYESVGLFNPKRQNNNDYRNYSEEDIIFLRKIKFLRELDVSIQDLKKLKSGELNLKECMLDKIKQIEKYEKNYKEIRGMCKDIIDHNLEYDDFDPIEYLQRMNRLNKDQLYISQV